MASSAQRPTKKAKTSNSLWKESECGTLLYLHDASCDGSHNKNKVAGFDLDGTLIRTKSGKTFATDELTDWELWANGGTKVMRPEMERLISEGFRVVIFTNQEGIGKGKVDRSKWQTKVERVIKALGFEEGAVTVLASLSKKENDYRKPHVGMWRFLCENLSNDPNVDVTESLYVGDAAGRPKRGIVKKDFSCSDYKFALNVGMTFQTPEQFFLHSKRPSDLASPTTSVFGFQPRLHWKECYEQKDLNVSTSAATDKLLESCRTCNGGREIIVLVGSPASGKSRMAERIVEISGGNYVRVNQDTLKTVAKCLKATKDAIESGKSAIVDNTNRDVSTRVKYADMAKAQEGVSCRCVWIQTTKEESFHLNALRGSFGTTNDERRMVPDVAIHGYYKYIAKPSCSKEGFTEVIELPFAPGPFDSKERKEAFFRFTH